CAEISPLSLHAALPISNLFCMSAWCQGAQVSMVRAGAWLGPACAVERKSNGRLCSLPDRLIIQDGGFYLWAVCLESCRSPAVCWTCSSEQTIIPIWGRSAVEWLF